MKYWNKSKKYRDTWTMVVMDNRHINNWEHLKHWCQNNSSKFRFYSGAYMRNIWYFENPEDALVFKLVWFR